ncbi:MAG: alpha/beta hydrolase [Eubacteriales bacterium]
MTRQSVLLMNAFRALHGKAKHLDLSIQRYAQSTVGKLLVPPNKYDFRYFDIGSLPCMWVNLRGIPKSRKVVLYCHGGGYTTGDLSYCQVLSSLTAQKSGYEVIAFDYPLAPEHPFPAQLDAAMAVWDYLIRLGYQEKDIIVLGESAGGHLALSLCRQLKQDGRELPSRLVLFSPWTDLTMSGSSYRFQLFNDPMISRDYIESVREYVVPSLDFDNPVNSPLFSDFTGYPPTLIHVGEHEVLQSDSTSLFDRMNQAGVDVRVKVFPDMWHVFHMFPIPEADEAMNEACEFIKSY